MADNLYEYRPTQRLALLTYEVSSALREFECLSSKAIMQYNRWARDESNEDLHLVPRALWAAHYITGWLSYALGTHRPQSEWIPRHQSELLQRGDVLTRNGHSIINLALETGDVVGMQVFVRERMDLLQAINDVLRRNAQDYSVALEVSEDLFVPTSPIGIDIRTSQSIGPTVYRQFYPDWGRISAVQTPPADMDSEVVVTDCIRDRD